MKYKVVVILVSAIGIWIGLALWVDSIFKAIDIVKKVWFTVDNELPCVLIVKDVNDIAGTKIGVGTFLDCQKPDGTKQLFLREFTPGK